MAYGTVAGVEGLLPSVGALSASTTPTVVEVNAWIDEGYAIINRYIASAGYSMPASSSADIYDELTGLNNLYAAAQVLLSRGPDTITEAGDSRVNQWMDRFYAQLTSIASSDLTVMGVSAAAATSRARRRIRTMQLRRIDGYSGEFEGEATEYENPSD